MRFFVQHQEKDIPLPTCFSGKVVSVQRDVAGGGNEASFQGHEEQSSRGAATEIVMSVFIIRAGDRVVCIDAGLPDNVTVRHRLCRDRLEEGAVYRVTTVVWLRGEKGLHIEGKDHTPTDGWRACRFRKLHGSDTTQTYLRTMRTVKYGSNSLNPPADRRFLQFIGYFGKTFESLQWAG